VFQSQFFERVILPDLNNKDPRRGELENFILRSKSQQSTEIDHVKQSTRSTT
jgi:hypothetical protein